MLSPALITNTLRANPSFKNRGRFIVCQDTAYNTVALVFKFQGREKPKKKIKTEKVYSSRAEQKENFRALEL